MEFSQRRGFLATSPTVFFEPQRCARGLQPSSGLSTSRHGSCSGHSPAREHGTASRSFGRALRNETVGGSFSAVHQASRAPAQSNASAAIPRDFGRRASSKTFFIVTPHDAPRAKYLGLNQGYLSGALNSRFAQNSMTPRCAARAEFMTSILTCAIVAEERPDQVADALVQRLVNCGSAKECLGGFETLRLWPCRRARIRDCVGLARVSHVACEVGLDETLFVRCRLPRVEECFCLISTDHPNPVADLQFDFVHFDLPSLLSLACMLIREIEPISPAQRFQAQLCSTVTLKKRYEILRAPAHRARCRLWTVSPGRR